MAKVGATRGVATMAIHTTIAINATSIVGMFCTTQHPRKHSAKRLLCMTQHPGGNLRNVAIDTSYSNGISLG